MFARLTIVAFVCLLLNGAASAVTITLNPGGNTTALTVLADDDPASGSPATDVSNPTALPFNTTDSISDAGANTSATYGFSGGRFDMSFSGAHSAVGDSTSRSTGEIWFTVDQNANYSLSGQWAVSDPNGKGKDVLLDVSFLDTTLPLTLFSEMQRSNNTADELFRLSDDPFTPGGGDADNSRTGSLTGTLLAGNVYKLAYTVEISNLAAANVDSGSATGSGFVNLVITPIPEPGTALLLGLGVVGLAAHGRRQRRATLR